MDPLVVICKNSPHKKEAGACVCPLTHKKALAWSSFVAVPVTALSAISMGAGLLASAESGQEADHQQGTDYNFEIFHGDMNSVKEKRRFSQNLHAAGAATAGRSALHSHHLFDVGVVTARAQDNLYVGLAPIAPIPAVIAGERCLQHTLVGGDPTTFLVAGRFS